MKRSEAVDIVRDVINKALIKYGASSPSFLVVASHNAIAELLEAGMQPPYTTTDIIEGNNARIKLKNFVRK